MMRFIGLLLLAMSVAVTPAWAEHGEGKGQCSMKGDCPHKDCEKGDCSKSDEGCGCPIVAKFMKKAHFFLKNADAIGLSEEQVSTIKALKTEAKKVMIQQKAGMEVSMLDIEAKLSEPKLDVEGINQIIDSGMSQMGTAAKASVERYVKLKAVLSEQQMTKAKELWKKD